MNPWLEIPLSDYESHMALPTVGQAQFLSAILRKVASECAPTSVAIIGCSGGNGFDALSPQSVKRVVGVDINPEYIETARDRYAGRFDDLVLICDDFLSPTCVVPPVDLLFAGLLFEYVDYLVGLSSIRRFIKPEGHLSVVLQLPCDSISTVSPSPYHSLKKLDTLLTLVEPESFRERAIALGMSIDLDDRVALQSGKSFQVLLMRNRKDSQSGVSFREERHR